MVLFTSPPSIYLGISGYLRVNHMIHDLNGTYVYHICRNVNIMLLKRAIFKATSIIERSPKCPRSDLNCLQQKVTMLMTSNFHTLFNFQAITIIKRYSFYSSKSCKKIIFHPINPRLSCFLRGNYENRL